MDCYPSFILVWLLIIFNTVGTNRLTHDTIEIRRQSELASEGHVYNITNCNPNIAGDEHDRIMEIETHGNCFNIYSEKGCTTTKGRFVRYQAGRLLTELSKFNKHRWDGELHVDDEHVQVKSVGPCFDKCDPRNWQGDSPSRPVTVTIYEDEDFTGELMTLKVEGDRCFPISVSTKASIKISGDESSCIELHDDPSCGGNFTQFRPGYPYLHDLWFYGIAGNDIAVYALAVAKCGIHCNKTVPEVNSNVEIHPGRNFVSLYDHPGFYGNARHINLTGGGCYNLTQRAASIRTYDQCVVLYEAPNCQQKRNSYTIQIGDQESVDYYLEKFLSSTLPTPITTSSIRLCDKQPNHQVTSPSPVAKSSDDATSPCANLASDTISTNKASFPMWAMTLIFLAEIILICFSALGGAYIFKRYENLRYARSENYNVSYQLHS